MAINKNHLFEELNGAKCAIVEANVSKVRMEFLKALLEYNGYKVEVITVEPKPKTASTDEVLVENIEPTLYTLGVTHLAFNATNAIFGRLLKTSNGKVVTQQYWLQNEKESLVEIPYFEN